MDQVKVDIVIFGGGIAGLWLFNQLQDQGYSAILFEKEALGSGQTIHSQGIIHGGIKYALKGILNRSSQSIADMPDLWKKCLCGEGSIDLSKVEILSENQYLWSTNQLSSKISTFFASKALRSRIEKVASEDYPEVWRHENFQGNVYKLNEVVLNTSTLLASMASKYLNKIFKISSASIDASDPNSMIVSNEQKSYRIQAQRFIFTCGAGNAEWAGQDKTQLRPLHMVLARGKNLPKVYAHCIGASSVPKATITSYEFAGYTIWYIGGHIAEIGVENNREQQAALAKTEMRELFPWIDWDDVEWSSFHVDRAEPLQSNNKRPDSYYFSHKHQQIFAWPTKLALAPLLASEIIKFLQNTIQPNGQEGQFPTSWQRPEIAKFPWEKQMTWIR